ncbi:3-methyl-2-oxobutanoate hydroxymethyltransferase [Texcoconibacillus texcoconensis]|uniref:3-methyl-2-oxobutanoate hydroxymethyltransferase n=1 Tax=Texcoconibacillus texcoconensis TaxID=1095777 RepID=A0A840QQF1_9BACI|nr:3-methyl-2-oxobutanoate hydroxymethyltransferase [Texcoconibacillus texcoconensis]MBB5173579.1 3-methyl-2-oxobutanoate hydroxymethyltransferase [Texcoconibacillus texcoconensis]
MRKIGKFRQMKQNGEKIAMLTAYDAPSARIAERVGVDLILVGDSVGMVMHGYDSTLPVTVDDMIMHSKAVRRGAQDTFIVADLPFMSYHISSEKTMEYAARFMQEAGADAIKVEGADDVVESIRRLTNAGVPVVGHLGLTPQSVAVLGGYRVQGKQLEDAKSLYDDARAIESAGACMLVLECVPDKIAAMIAKELSIPVIGIGAGEDTDGQVLVFHDVIGFNDGHIPKFVRQYANVGAEIEKGITSYVQDVKEKAFPASEHTFSTDDHMMKQFLAYVEGGAEDENNTND